MCYDVVFKKSNELINVFETAWYQKTYAETTPGVVVHIYRENLGLSQAELGQKIGNSEDIIAVIEANKRPITRELAEKFSQIL